MPQVRQLGPERWGTRERAPGLRGLGWFEDEFLEGDADDYVLAGIEGARTEEPSLQYLVVTGRLGVFVNAQADARGHAALQDAADVQELGIIALQDGPLAGEGRLSVLHNAYSTRRWRWTGKPESGGLDGLAGALDWLRRL